MPHGAKGSVLACVNSLAVSVGASDARPAWEHLLKRTKDGTATTYPAAETLLVLLWNLRSAGRTAAAISLELLVARLGLAQSCNCDHEPVLKVLFLLSQTMASDSGLGTVSRQALYETGCMPSTRAAGSFLRRSSGRQTEAELQRHLKNSGSLSAWPSEPKQQPLTDPDPWHWLRPQVVKNMQECEAQSEVEVKAPVKASEKVSGFFDNPRCELADHPEPDSEPPCMEAARAQPAMKSMIGSVHEDAAHGSSRQEKWQRLWESTVSAVDSRESWGHIGASTSSQAAGSLMLRFAWLALHGISSSCFKVRDMLVQCIAKGSQQSLLGAWADICSSCMRLKQLSGSLGRSASLTAQALGSVNRDLLNILDGKVAAALREGRSFLQFWVGLQPWLRQLQEVLALHGCQKQSKQPVAQALSALSQGQLLDGLLGFVRAHELSALRWQACSRPRGSLEPAHPMDLVPLWILQRSLQPLFQSLTVRMRGEESDAPSRGSTFPDFLSSIHAPLSSLPHKLRILDCSEPGDEASYPVYSSGRCFDSFGREARAFASTRSDLDVDENEETNPMRNSGCRLLVSAHGGSRPPDPEAAKELTDQLVFRRTSERLRGLQAQSHRPSTPQALPATTTAAANLEDARQKQQKQQEYKAALDAQVAERAELLRNEGRREEETALAVLQPPSPRTLQDAREALAEGHRQRMQQAAQEQQLLKWKLHRLRGTPASSDHNRPEQPGFLAATALACSPAEGPVELGSEQEAPQEVAHGLKGLVRTVLQGLYARAGVHQAPVAEAPSTGAASAVRTMLEVPLDVEATAPTSPLRPIEVQNPAPSSPLVSADGNVAATAKPEAFERPPLYTEAESMDMTEDAEMIWKGGAVPLEVSLENCLIRPLRIQSHWVEKAVVTKFVFELNLPRHLKLMQRYILMGESRLLEPFLAKAIALYANRPILEEASVVEGALQALFQSVVPRPSSPEDDALLSRIFLQLSPAPSLLGHGPVSFLDGIRFRMKLEFPMSEIFTERVLMQYTRLFRIIALAHHALECLKGAWGALAGLGAGSRGSAMPPTALIALRHELHHFAATIHRYLLVDVVATEFKQLEAKVMEASSLDTLLAAHSGCLRRCVARSFLEAGSQDALTAVVGILDQALELSCLLEEVDLQLPSLPASVIVRLRRIETTFCDLRRSLKLCYMDGGLAEADGLVQEVLPAADDFS
ncbi:tubgcp3 [Symbiodinium sp. CCMP2456]|nr:tubgcp3 [Symbiodinium sp. CCMP2456]